VTGSARIWGTALLAAALLGVTAAPAADARGGPKPTTSPTGYDISWPQCGGQYPHGQAFGIVGLNDGLANTLNPCLASELAWAAGSDGSTSLPAAAIYVNTADPGQVIDLVSDWPLDNIDPAGGSEAPGSAAQADPYGPCDGTDTPACSWQYGWNRAVQDILWLQATSGAGFSNAPASYPWWLDVETGNTWESGGGDGWTNNVADLEGMAAALHSVGQVSVVGIYSTSYQWSVITGGLPGDGTLAGIPDWIPGARSQSGAQSNCSLPSFTGGPVLIAQWFGRLDGDLACAG
jgi:hypothetical protein